MATPLRVLLIEDSVNDTELLLCELRRGDYTPTWERVDSAAALTAALTRQEWDVITLGCIMPQFSASAALALLREHGSHAPIIIVSGEVGEEGAVTAMKAGAHDYVSKRKLARLVPAIKRELREADGRRARKDSDDALRESQHWLALALNAADICLWSWNVRTNDLYLSPRWIAQLGYEEDEIPNTFEEWATHIHPDDRDRLLIAVPTYLQEPTVEYEVEFRARHKDGSYRWFLSRASLVKDEGGQPERLMGCHIDITDRKSAEAAQREEAHIAAALARAGRELIAALDTPQFLDRLCQVTTELLGCESSHTLLWEPEEDVFKPIAGYGATPEEQEAARLIKVPRALMSEVLSRLDTDDVAQVGTVPPDLLSTPAQERFGVALTLCMALRRGQELIGLQVAMSRHRFAPFTETERRIARGVAQIASLALDHAQMVSALERANRLKSEFFATVSHELRTPINVVVGYTDLLLEGSFGALNPEQVDTLQRVQGSSRELLTLIDSTLDLSRLEAGRMEVAFADVDLTRLINEIDRETRGLHAQSNVTVLWKVAPDLRVRTDAAKLKRVLKNLIGNALKFTDDGGVTLEAYASDDGLEIAVTDTGIGIAPDALPIIFEPFRQVDSSSTRRHGGVGLGLYIVRRLLDMLGGSITVESEVGRGSTFRVRVPLRDARAEKERA
jgi:PAS domain S-box-containing protein